ncbi:hypothetical protein [Modicisalibacter luteus]|uniref:Uncharacterized protein n=1 Tax=Modicisalibacter luteus TaxID=453962 RepID=A0ABV7M2Z6_9GAMM|nr:hypothetical protein [Halomonas lutea]GHB15743.1 hypothetical protein GCM10007159_42550 [Halomonas lutea]
MARRREIRPEEATLWLGVLLDAAFDPTSKTLNLARSAEIANQAAQKQGMAGALRLTARDGQSQLLALASDFVSYPEEQSDKRRAELLLGWAEHWMLPEDWTRLAARVRKRRERT